MKSARALKTLLVAGLLAASVVLMAGCASSSNPNDGIAATVNGHEIRESAVTREINYLRMQVGLTDDDRWGMYLALSGTTPEGVREIVIDYLVQQQLMIEAASDLGISVDESDVDAAVERFKANYSSDKSWQQALEQSGFTEETYRESVSDSMVLSQISEYFTNQVEPTDDDYVESARQYAEYYDGAKRSSHILIAVSDTADDEEKAAAYEKAQNIIALINSGSLSFEEAVELYSDDTGSKSSGGDVGWDKMSSFITEYTDALATLEEGQMTSEPVESDYGYHIITVTDVFEAPESEEIVSLDQIPEESQETIIEMTISSLSNTLQSEWLATLEEGADININPMPSGLSYDVDLSAYEEMGLTNALTNSDGVTTVEADGLLAEAADNSGDSEDTAE